MNIEIKPYRWQERGENYGSHFYVFVDGEPRKDLSDCINCSYFRGHGNDCVKLQEVGPYGDELIYPFCGSICGYFTLKEDDEA